MRLPTEETLSTPRSTLPDESVKRETYRLLLHQAEGILSGVDDPVTVMATTVAILHHALPYASWTGFYRLVNADLLRVGPFQGPVACLEVAVGTGVCGTAAAEGRTQVVPDVHAFPGHIACDAAARSEIVVPVYGGGGDVIAVLDLDSHQPAAFDEIDRQGLESLAAMLSGRLRPDRL